MNSISIETITWRRNIKIMNQDSNAIVELEVALRTVLNCYASDGNVKTSIKPQSLYNTRTELCQGIFHKLGNELKKFKDPVQYFTYSWFDPRHLSHKLTSCLS